MTRTTKYAFLVGALTSFAIASNGCGGASKNALPNEDETTGGMGGSTGSTSGTGGAGGPATGSGGSTGSTGNGGSMMMTPGGGGRPAPGNMGGAMGPVTRTDGGFFVPVGDGGVLIPVPPRVMGCQVGLTCAAGQTCSTACGGRGTQTCTCFQGRYACGACDAPDGGNANPFQPVVCPAGNPNGVACMGNSNCTSAPTDGGRQQNFCRCNEGTWDCPFLPQPACAAGVMDNAACMTRGARCSLAAVATDAGRQGRTQQCECNRGGNDMNRWNCN